MNKLMILGAGLLSGLIASTSIQAQVVGIAITPVRRSRRLPIRWVALRPAPSPSPEQQPICR